MPRFEPRAGCVKVYMVKIWLLRKPTFEQRSRQTAMFNAIRDIKSTVRPPPHCRTAVPLPPPATPTPTLQSGFNPSHGENKYWILVFQSSVFTLWMFNGWNIWGGGGREFEIIMMWGNWHWINFDCSIKASCRHDVINDLTRAGKGISIALSWMHEQYWCLNLARVYASKYTRAL